MGEKEVWWENEKTKRKKCNEEKKKGKEGKGRKVEKTMERRNVVGDVKKERE